MANLLLKNINKTFGSFEALSGVELEIKSGEFICLLGASGCGKTTLLRIIAGLESLSSGDMELDGVDLASLPCHQRNVGMVFQSLALFPHLTVGENIGFGLDVRGIKPVDSRAQVEDLLKLVDLQDSYYRSVSTLSGGQQQRVAIARALAIEPSLFLMDEPFSALDANLRDRLQVEVKKIQRKLGVTTVFVTHDQHEAMSISDRIVILNNGRIEQAGTPTEVYAQPVSEFVARFMGTNNVFEVDFSNDGFVYYEGKNIGKTPPYYHGLVGHRKIAVRPEYISLLSVKDNANTLTGKVVFVRYLGASIETELDVGGRSFIQTQISDKTVEYTINSELEVCFNLEHAWVLES